MKSECRVQAWKGLLKLVVGKNRVELRPLPINSAGYYFFPRLHTSKLNEPKVPIKSQSSGIDRYIIVYIFQGAALHNHALVSFSMIARVYSFVEAFPPRSPVIVAPSAIVCNACQKHMTMAVENHTPRAACSIFAACSFKFMCLRHSESVSKFMLVPI